MDNVLAIFMQLLNSCADGMQSFIEANGLTQPVSGIILAGLFITGCIMVGTLFPVSGKGKRSSAK